MVEILLLKKSSSRNHNSLTHGAILNSLGGNSLSAGRAPCNALNSLGNSSLNKVLRRDLGHLSGDQCGLVGGSHLSGDGRQSNPFRNRNNEIKMPQFNLHLPITIHYQFIIINYTNTYCTSIITYCTIINIITKCTIKCTITTNNCSIKCTIKYYI
eukprot:84049_1